MQRLIANVTSNSTTDDIHILYQYVLGHLYQKKIMANYKQLIQRLQLIHAIPVAQIQLRIPNYPTQRCQHYPTYLHNI